MPPSTFRLSLAGDQPKSTSIIDLGMDVHKDSFRLAILPYRVATPTRLDRLRHDLAVLGPTASGAFGRQRAVLAALGPALTLHEATGDYELALIEALAESLLSVFLVNPSQVRDTAMGGTAAPPARPDRGPRNPLQPR